MIKSNPRVLLLLFIVLGTCTQYRAAVPELTAVFPTGCRRGESVEVILKGKELKNALSLHFSRPGITANRVAEQKFRVHVSEQVELGNCDVWVATPDGLAGPRHFYVAALPGFVEVESKDKLDQAQHVTVPCIVDGRLDRAAEIDWFQFDCMNGQGYSIFCQSLSIDGSVNPTLALLSPDGQEVAHSTDDRREPAIHFRASQSGPYRLRVCDRAYRQDNYSHYRIIIATGPRMLHAFPHVLNRSLSQIQIYGLDLSSASEEPNALQELTVTIDPPKQRDRRGRGPGASPLLDGFLYRKEDLFGGVWLGLTDLELVVDSASNNSHDTAQPISLPCRVAGRIEQRGDVDWYRFSAKKSQSIHVDSFGERGGLQMDLDIVIHDSQGKMLTTLPDLAAPKGVMSHISSGSLDAGGNWKVPADGDYFMVVRDLYGGSVFGIERTYEVVLGPNQIPLRVYALPTDKDGSITVSAKPGQTMKLWLIAEPNSDFEGTIRVTAAGLPKAVQAAPVIMSAKEVTKTMELKVAKDAPPGVFQIELWAEVDHESEQRKYPVVYLIASRPGAKPRRIDQLMIHIRQ